MALKARDPAHQAQIAAGTVGRSKGHRFEKELTQRLRCLNPIPPVLFKNRLKGHLVRGAPESELVRYILRAERILGADRLEAWWLGGLATSGEGDKLIVDGQPLTGSKSDILLRIHCGAISHTLGVSIKTCNKSKPTNDQLYFTTAVAFCELLRRNGLVVSTPAEHALRMFCGDKGFRPCDAPVPTVGRLSDPDRWFWEELPPRGRALLEDLFRDRQDEITRILLQKAYPLDPYPPRYVLHQTGTFSDREDCPLALFSVDELVTLSKAHCAFQLREYRIRKGRFKDDPNIHLAPRFGFVQFQRGGQKQHPTQLQFNLKAGYFNHV